MLFLRLSMGFAPSGAPISTALRTNSENFAFALKPTNKTQQSCATCRKKKSPKAWKRNAGAYCIARKKLRKMNGPTDNTSPQSTAFWLSIPRTSILENLESKILSHGVR